MEKEDGFGKGTSHNHRTQMSNNVTAQLDTTLKDKVIFSYEGPKTFQSDWKQSPPSLQTSNGQILAQTGQSESNSCTTLTPREDHPQLEFKHFSSNDTQPEITGLKPLLQCPIQLSSSTLNWQNVSSASTTNHISQQSMPHVMALDTNHLTESCKNSVYNPHQQQVMITYNLPKDSICQRQFTSRGHFGVILTKGQTIKLCQQNDCMPKNIYQQKFVPQKAIAVVTPLTQQVVAGETLSKNLAKMTEGGLETRSVLNKNDHQNDIPHTSQLTAYECGAKTLCDNTSQMTKEPIKSLLGTGLSHVKDDGPVENNKLIGQSETLSSILQRKDEVQPCPTDNCNARVMGRNSEGTETRRDGEMDKLSTITVNKWSLQRLRTLVNDLEQMQKMVQKDRPSHDLSSQIMKLYWKGDYQKLCSALKSNIYVDIMKDVRLYCGKENAILNGVSRKRLNELASSFHILEHGFAPPKMVYTSSWLNVGEKWLCDIDEDQDSQSPLMTLYYERKIADKEVPIKEMKKMQEPGDEKIKASKNVLSEGQKQSKPAEHQKNSSVNDDKMVTKEAMVIDDKNTCSVKETERQDNMLFSSSTQSSDSCIKPGNLLNLPTADMTTVLDKNGSADCISVEFLPEKPADQPDNKVNDMQKDVQILTDSRCQVTMEQKQKHMNPKMKSDVRGSGIKINRQLENYCCLSKWFHVLGYRNGGICKCEKKAGQNHHADISGKSVKDINSDKHPFHKDNKLTDTNICVLRNSRKAKHRLGCRSMSGTKLFTSHVDDDATMDELEIVDVVTDYEDVLEIANAVSEQTPLIARTSHVSRTGRKLCRDNSRKVPDLKTGDTLINLALFGTSHQRQKKNVSGFKSMDNVQLPPETINVIINSGKNDYPVNNKSQTTKQQVWNSWRKSFVPSKMSMNRKSKMQKCLKAPESEKDDAGNSVINTTAFDLISNLLSQKEDAQTHRSKAKSAAHKQKNRDTDLSQKKSRKISSTRKDKIRQMKPNKMSSFNLNKRRIGTNNRSKLIKSSIDPAQAVKRSKNKLNTDLALNFKVLPESFNISHDFSSMEANHPSSADSGSKVTTVVQMKRTWSMSGSWTDSPRKKHCLKSTPTLPNTSRPSTFQEFKKKYEEKKRIPS